MSLVDREYNLALDRMSGAERLARTRSLYTSAREMIALQVFREEPELSSQLAQIRIARRMYSSDLKTQQLLDKIESSLG